MDTKASIAFLIAVTALLGCGNGDDSPQPSCAPAADAASEWQVVTLCREKGELLSVWGTSRSDVWTVGAGGQALHFDGCKWTEMDAGTTEDLWWVFGFEGGPTYLSGGKGTIIKYEGGAFSPMDTGVGFTVFGVWGTSPSDLYAVGFDNDGAEPGAVLHYDGTAWSKVTGLPAVVTEDTHFFKVWGTGPEDVWVVGRQDLVLHYDGAAWTDEATGEKTDWITVTGTSDAVVIVGGKSNATIAERDGDGWKQVAPEFLQTIQGVCLQADGSGLGTGLGASFVRRDSAGNWTEEEDAPFDLFTPNAPPVAGCSSPTPDYHACWADGSGGLFVVGGNFFGPLTEGALLHYGPKIGTEGL